MKRLQVLLALGFAALTAMALTPVVGALPQDCAIVCTSTTACSTSCAEGGISITCGVYGVCDSGSGGGSGCANYIYGTDLSDTIYGTSANDCIYGLAGDDTLSGSTGYDFLNGGPGFDYCTGGETYVSCEYMD